MFRKSSRCRRPSVRARSLSLERLECRLLLAVGVDFSAVAISRELNGLSTEYEFFAVVEGDGIQSAYVRSPGGTQYDMSYLGDGEWEYMLEGDQATVTGMFPDGTYTVHADYVGGGSYDGTAFVGGAMPPFPDVTYPADGYVCETNPNIQWAQWTPKSEAEKFIIVELEDGPTDTYLGGTDDNFLASNKTSFQVPKGILEEGHWYEGFVSFVILSDDDMPWGGKISGLAGEFVVDLAPPVVTDASPVPGSVVNGNPAPDIVVTFSEQMDPTAIAAPGNFEVWRSAGDGVFGGGPDVQILGTVTVAPNGLSATFTPDGPLADDLYEVRLDGSNSVTDLAGRVLDGESMGVLPSGDGDDGGDFAYRFVVDNSGEIAHIWFNQAGPGRVYLLDTSLADDPDPEDFQVKFGKSGVNITMGGDGTTEGVALTVVGIDGSASLKDGRGGEPQPLAFFASTAPVKSLSLKTGTTGVILNGADKGGIMFPADMDHDGDLLDTTGVYIGGWASKVAFGGTTHGDIIIEEADAKGYSAKTIQAKGMISGHVYLAGAAGKVQTAEHMTGDLTVLGVDAKGYSLKAFQTGKECTYQGTIGLAGSAGKIAVGRLGTATSAINVLGDVKSVCAYGDWDGSMTVGGVAGKISADDFTSQADITVNGIDARGMSVKSIASSGQMSTDLATLGGVGKASVKNGEMSAATWNIGGDLSSLSVKGPRDGGPSGKQGQIWNSDINVAGLIKSVKVSLDMKESSLHAGELARVAIGGTLMSSTADEIRADIGSFLLQVGRDKYMIDPLSPVTLDNVTAWVG